MKDKHRRQVSTDPPQNENVQNLLHKYELFQTFMSQRQTHPEKSTRMKKENGGRRRTWDKSKILSDVTPKSTKELDDSNADNNVKVKDEDDKTVTSVARCKNIKMRANQTFYKDAQVQNNLALEMGLKEISAGDSDTPARTDCRPQCCQSRSAKSAGCDREVTFYCACKENVCKCTAAVTKRVCEDDIDGPAGCVQADGAAGCCKDREAIEVRMAAGDETKQVQDKDLLFCCKCNSNGCKCVVLKKRQSLNGPSMKTCTKKTGISDIRIVDYNDGHKEPIELSGRSLKYVFKKDFGRTPAYLKKRKAALIKMKEVKRQQEQAKRAADRDRSCPLLPEDKRLELINGLKQKWEEVHTKYQKLSLSIDTVAKKNRKVRLEEALQQLEKDITTLERYRFIYIK